MIITIRNDDEGFLGSASSAEIEQINIPASLNNYEAAVTTALRRVWPDAEINHLYEPYAGASIIISDTDDEHGSISDEIQEIVGDIYNAGMFWVSAATITYQVITVDHANRPHTYGKKFTALCEARASIEANIPSGEMDHYRVLEITERILPAIA